MAWEARSGLKHSVERRSPVAYLRLNGLGSPFGIETRFAHQVPLPNHLRLNGLGSPFGIETYRHATVEYLPDQAKWPGKPVRD